jgi:DNA-binding transcriptional LysR family regulator
MWEQVELREVRVFLVLAEELHFGRTAEQLGLTQSRVSQVLRELERKLGGQLLSRTSRRVTLTPMGKQLLADAEPLYAQLSTVLERIETANRSLAGELRVALLVANAGGPYLTEIIQTFERRHPETDVVVSEMSFPDPLGPLRRGEVDVLATRLPLEQPDLVVGPVLVREPRILVVAEEHPMAQRDQVSIEDVAAYDVAPITDTPKELIDALVPRRTPSGRPIRRLARRPKTPHELAELVARGRIVHPTVPSFAAYYGRPGIVQIPITDMPPMASGLVWRRKASNPRLRAFIQVTREVMAARRSSPTTGRRRKAE